MHLPVLTEQVSEVWHVVFAHLLPVNVTDLRSGGSWEQEIILKKSAHQCCGTGTATLAIAEPEHVSVPEPDLDPDPTQNAL